MTEVPRPWVATVADSVEVLVIWLINAHLTLLNGSVTVTRK